MQPNPFVGNNEAAETNTAEKEALLDPNCGQLIFATLEETLSNLAQEILVEEFDPFAQPKRYVCPAGGHR